MPEGYVNLISTQPVESRAKRFARGEETERPEPPTIVRLPGLPPRQVEERDD